MLTFVRLDPQGQPTTESVDTVVDALSGEFTADVPRGDYGLFFHSSVACPTITEFIIAAGGEGIELLAAPSLPDLQPGTATAFRFGLHGIQGLSGILGRITNINIGINIGGIGGSIGIGWTPAPRPQGPIILGPNGRPVDSRGNPVPTPPSPVPPRLTPSPTTVVPPPIRAGGLIPIPPAGPLTSPPMLSAPGGSFFSSDPCDEQAAVVNPVSDAL
jgi:hypothetical protein